MQPGNVVGGVRDAIAAWLAASEELAARMDEIDAIGGVAALESHMTAAADALGFTYADLQSAVASSGNVRNVLRNVAATFPQGSHTNFYKLRT